MSTTGTIATMEFDSRQTMHIANALSTLIDSYEQYLREFTENPNNSWYKQATLDAFCKDETGSTPDEIRKELQEIRAMKDQFALIHSVQRQLDGVDNS